MSFHIAVDAEVVQKDFHEVIQEFFENSVDRTLVCGWCSRQAEWHVDPRERPPFGDECSMPAVLFPNFDRLIRWGWTSVTRFREYRQDAFAHSLGYGKSLSSALTKLSALGINAVNQYEVIMRHNHPIIYNRIERLEKLVGLGDRIDQTNIL